MYHGQRKSAHVLCRSGAARLWRRCLACPGRVCGVCATGSMGASIGRFWDWRLRGRRAGPTRSTQGISLGARQNHGRRWVGTVGSRARWHSVDATLGARSQCPDEEKTAAVLGVLHWVKSGARGSLGLAGARAWRVLNQKPRTVQVGTWAIPVPQRMALYSTVPPRGPGPSIPPVSSTPGQDRVL